MASGEVDDAEAAATWLREKHPDLPMTLLGFPSVALSPPASAGAWKPRASSRTCSWSPGGDAPGRSDLLPQNCPLTLSAGNRRSGRSAAGLRLVRRPQTPP
jgi:hypothetical protein